MWVLWVTPGRGHGETPLVVADQNSWNGNIGMPSGVNNFQHFYNNMRESKILRFFLITINMNTIWQVKCLEYNSFEWNVVQKKISVSFRGKVDRPSVHLSIQPGKDASWPDMRKGVDTRTLSAEILMNCGNCLLETLNLSCIFVLKLKYYGTFTYIMQYDHLNAHLNLIKVTNHA